MILTHRRTPFLCSAKSRIDHVVRVPHEADAQEPISIDVLVSWAAFVLSILSLTPSTRQRLVAPTFAVRVALCVAIARNFVVAAAVSRRGGARTEPVDAAVVLLARAV